MTPNDIEGHRMTSPRLRSSGYRALRTLLGGTNATLPRSKDDVIRAVNAGSKGVSDAPLDLRWIPDEGKVHAGVRNRIGWFPAGQSGREDFEEGRGFAQTLGKHRMLGVATASREDRTVQLARRRF